MKQGLVSGNLLLLMFWDLLALSSFFSQSTGQISYHTVLRQVPQNIKKKLRSAVHRTGLVKQKLLA